MTSLGQAQYCQGDCAFDFRSQRPKALAGSGGNGSLSCLVVADGFCPPQAGAGIQPGILGLRIQHEILEKALYVARQDDRINTMVYLASRRYSARRVFCVQK